MDRVGSQAFRTACVEAIVETGWYDDKERFLERYLGGEDFDYKKLKKMGYDHFLARNLAAYINNSHNDDYYSHALGWE